MYHLIIMVIIIVQCCYIVSLWLFWIWKIQECHLYFAPPLPRGFDHFCGAGWGRKGVSQGGAGNPPSPQGRASIPGAYPRLYCRTPHFPCSILIFNQCTESLKAMEQLHLFLRVQGCLVHYNIFNRVKVPKTRLKKILLILGKPLFEMCCFHMCIGRR